MTNPVIDKDGNKYWFNSDNELHREDGPAVEYSDGTKFWYINGECHRDNGPAIIYRDGSKVWCIRDVIITANGLLTIICPTMNNGMILSRYCLN